MKKITIYVFALALVFPFTASAKTPKKGKYGIYFQSLQILEYAVDSVTQECYVIFTSAGGGGGMETVDCEALLKRPEWKPIITWIKEPRVSHNEQG